MQIFPTCLNKTLKSRALTVINDPRLSLSLPTYYSCLSLLIFRGSTSCAIKVLNELVFT